MTASITSFFTAPSMGMSPACAEQAIPAFEDIIIRWLSTVRPPRFPGTIDATRVHSAELQHIITSLIVERLAAENVAAFLSMLCGFAEGLLQVVGARYRRCR